MRSNRPLLLDLGQPGCDVPGDVGGREGRLDQALAQQVEGIGDLPFGDVDIHGQPRITHSRTEGHATTLGAAVLGERLGAAELLGGALMLAAAALVLGDRRTSAPSD
jgi:hypothetical protein